MLKKITGLFVLHFDNNATSLERVYVSLNNPRILIHPDGFILSILLHKKQQNRNRAKPCGMP